MKTVNRVAEVINNIRKTESSDKVKLKKHLFILLLWAALSLLAPLSTPRAQNKAPKPMEFLPESVFSVSLQMEWTSKDGVLTSGFERESLLKNKLSANGVPSDAVSGRMAQQSIAQYFSVQYGWSHDFNIGFTAPYLFKTRQSDLQAIKSEGEEFVEANGGLNANGLGDMEIWGLWRPIYSDGLDFHMGLAFNADNGFHSYSEKDELSLGSGAREFSAFLKWRIYSDDSRWMADIKAQGTVSRSTEVSGDDGKEYSMQRANSFSALLSLSRNHKAFYFGGSFIVENQGETTIGNSGLQDGYLSYSCQLFMNYGNLFLLEKSLISLPWEVQIVFEQVVSGNNAPQNRILGLGATAYF